MACAMPVPTIVPLKVMRSHHLRGSLGKFNSLSKSVSCIEATSTKFNEATLSSYHGRASSSSWDLRLQLGRQQQQHQIRHTSISSILLSGSAGRRAIVSTFLCLGTPLDPRFEFLLLRRSRGGHVYAGKWGVVSGSIEPDDESPLHAALREIREETGLAGLVYTTTTGGKVGGTEAAAGLLLSDPTEARDPDVDGGDLGSGNSIELLVEGDKFDIVDSRGGEEVGEDAVTWEIYPFLMRIDRHEAGSIRATSAATTKTGYHDEHDEHVFVRPHLLSDFDTVQGLAATLERLTQKYLQTQSRRGGSNTEGYQM